MELDEAYAIVPHIHAAAEFPPRWAASAADFRNSLKDRAQLDVAYGDTPRARYDLFWPETAHEGAVCVRSRRLLGRGMGGL